MLKAASSPRWPKMEDIAECQRMKYVFQAFFLVFINFIFSHELIIYFIVTFFPVTIPLCLF